MLSQIKPMVWYLRARLSRHLDLDQRGAETLEWILIGAILVGAAIAIYGTLESGLNSTVSNITTKLDTAAQ